jgi:hypothetical protein
MSFLNTTQPNDVLDSPGSSVFDLPTQPGPSADKTNDETPFRTSAANGPASLGKIVNNGALNGEDGPSFLVVSGGTGCNSICSAFGNATYVLPVSDDGGSSSEIIRVIGGPSVGA